MLPLARPFLLREAPLSPPTTPAHVLSVLVGQAQADVHEHVAHPQLDLAAPEHQQLADLAAGQLAQVAALLLRPAWGEMGREEGGGQVMR